MPARQSREMWWAQQRVKAKWERHAGAPRPPSQPSPFTASQSATTTPPHPSPPCECSPSLSAQIPFCSQFLSLVSNAGLCLWSMLLSLPPCLHIVSCLTLFSSTCYAKSFAHLVNLSFFKSPPLLEILQRIV